MKLRAKITTFTSVFLILVVALVTSFSVRNVQQ